MILLADSGSTKTEWYVIDGNISNKSVITSGINPYFLSSDEIFRLLADELGQMHDLRPDMIWFYGTGCNSEQKNSVVTAALGRFFKPECIMVGSDLLGAARSLCQRDPGIACIIGTGSNSCYYDGSRIVSNVAPLGYILGDEGGAAVLGRKLLSGVFKNQVSSEVAQKFYDTYRITRSEILENVYMRPFPNRFLGKFAKFISENIMFPELRQIVDSSFDEFIDRNINQYAEAGKYPVNFTGSVAYHFRTCLEDRLKRHNLITGKIVLTPMQDLIRYHSSDK